MGSIPLDNGESVYIHDGTGSADPVAISAAEGSSVANLMKNRERFDYTWADATERGAQTGMLQGSRGYQEDSKTEYIYDNSVWRLATPYAEFSLASITAGGGYTALSGWSADATRSTDSSIVTITGNGVNFVRAGLYAMSIVASATQTATSFLDITTDGTNPPSSIVAIGPFVANVGQVALPAYRILADNTPLYVWVGNVASNPTSLALRIVRLG